MGKGWLAIAVLAIVLIVRGVTHDQLTSPAFALVDAPAELSARSEAPIELGEADLIKTFDIAATQPAVADPASFEALDDGGGKVEPLKPIMEGPSIAMFAAPAPEPVVGHAAPGNVVYPRYLQGAAFRSVQTDPFAGPLIVYPISYSYLFPVYLSNSQGGANDGTPSVAPPSVPPPPTTPPTTNPPGVIPPGTAVPEPTAILPLLGLLATRRFRR